LNGFEWAGFENETGKCEMDNRLGEQRRYVTVKSPVEREGVRYYGCLRTGCATCEQWDGTGNGGAGRSLFLLEYYFPVHCFSCHSEMFLDDISDEDVARMGGRRFQIVADQRDGGVVLCTVCHRRYLRIRSKR